jgi:hypothetical protein
MTSENITEYRIEKDGKQVGHHREHAYCNSHYEVLLKFQPLKDFTIQPHVYDEEDEYWEGDKINLEDYLRKLIPYNEVIKDFFSK